MSAKIRVPKPHKDLIPRPLLCGRLEKALSHPLVLISAPAGFGKTSLAAQYVTSLEQGNPAASRTGAGGRMLVAWVSLDLEDDDPIRFWSLVAASFERAFLTLGEPSISCPFASISAAAQSLQPPGELELASAVMDGVLTTGESLLFVLDDFHRLHSERIMVSFTRFLESLPEQIRVIILSRVDPPLPLARFRARGLMTELRAQELRFDLAEATAILQEALGDSLSEEHAQVIEDRTEGWGAGLRLAALSLQRRTDRESFIAGFSDNNRLILEFLTEEVLAVQPKEIQAFLLASAVLDRFCAGLCDTLLGAGMLPHDLPPGLPPSKPSTNSRFSTAGELLHHVEAANLFIVPLDDEGVWYRYHHLFAHTLRARLRLLAPDAEQRILGIAASWHEARGELETAMGLHLRAGCRPEAARLLEGIDYFARGEMGTLVARLNELGEEIVFSRPALMDLPGWTKAFAGKFPDAAAYITKARSRMEGLDDEGRRYVQGSFASLEAFMGFLRGDLRVAVEKAKEADSLLGPDAYYPRSIIPYVEGSVHRMEGRFNQARAAFHELESIGHRRGSIWTISAARYEVAISHYYVGDLSLAAEILASALADADSRGAGRYASLAKLRALYADILYERGQWDQSEQQVDMMMESAERGGIAPSLLELYASKIRLLLGKGRVTDTLVYFSKARTIMESGGVLTRSIADMNDLVYRAACIAGKAAPSDRAVQRPAQDCITERIAQCTDIQESLFHSEFELAHRRAGELAVAAQQGAWGTFYVKSMILDFQALLGLHRKGEALKALETALHFGRPRGFLRVYLDYGGTALAGELRHLQSTTADLKLLCEAVLAEAGGTTPDPMAGIVSVREREVLSLLVQGLSNQDIADRLFISESTVKTHLHNLSAKWKVPNRVAVLAKARSLGIV